MGGKMSSWMYYSRLNHCFACSTKLHEMCLQNKGSDSFAAFKTGPDYNTAIASPIQVIVSSSAMNLGSCHFRNRVKGDPEWEHLSTKFICQAESNC